MEFHGLDRKMIFKLLFVAVGYSGTILTSSDGTSWTTKNSGTLYGVTYGIVNFVSGASGTTNDGFHGFVISN